MDLEPSRWFNSELMKSRIPPNRFNKSKHSNHNDVNTIGQLDEMNNSQALQLRISSDLSRSSEPAIILIQMVQARIVFTLEFAFYLLTSDQY